MTARIMLTVSSGTLWLSNSNVTTPAQVWLRSKR
jgi:hypothetical protein